MKSTLKLVILFMLSCNNTPVKKTPKLTYFEIGINANCNNWRDTSFIIATANPALIEEARLQLKLPLKKRKLLTGEILQGSAGYNKNETHSFKWHFKEDAWQLAEFSIKLCDGYAYSDVDLDIDYWLNEVKRFCPWDSYVKKEIIMEE